MFLSMFALDVFNEGYGLTQTILALIMHLVPTYLVVIALVIAWRWEGVGAILFTALALFYLAMSKGGSWITSGPLLLIGFLFFFNWKYKEQLKSR
jgi:hypothetical protein